MRAFALLSAALLTGTSAAAQSVIQPDHAWLPSAPNARAAQPPLGPNAKAALRPVGPNRAIARRNGGRDHAQAHYPSCSALGSVRAGPVSRGERGYGRHLDPDGTGVACDPREDR